MILFCLIVAYFIVFKGPLEDLNYWIKREESPRAKARREYQQAHGGSIGGKLAHAVADRAAARIANPRGPGRLRRYLGGLADDAIYAAEDTRRRRQAEKEARRRGEPAGKVGDVPTSPDGLNDTSENLNGERRHWWQWRRRPAPAPTGPAADQAGPEPSEPAPENRTAPEAEPAEPVEDIGATPPPPPGGIPFGAPSDGPDSRTTSNNGDGRTHYVDDDGDPLNNGVPHESPRTATDSGTWTQPETAPPGVVYATATRLDQTPRLAITAGSSPTAQQYGGFPMSENVSDNAAGEGGLANYQNYVTNMQNQAQSAIGSLDTTIGSMVTDKWGPAVTGPMTSASDLFGQITNLLSQASAALVQSNIVKDGYQAADHTGSKESVLHE